jgi:1,4-alpha-glucan branching enzyme
MFMGMEFGHGREWNYDNSLDWHLLDYSMHTQIRQFVQDLNRTYVTERSLHEIDFEPAGFQWIDCNDSENSVISFIRRAKDPNDLVVALLNFTPVPRMGYRVGVPVDGAYMELMNSDAEIYGGSNCGNGGVVFSESIASHGHPHSLYLNLPPLGFLLLKPSR